MNDHYKKRRFEPIEVIEEYGLGFNLGNVVKYVLREKDDVQADRLKAAWYLLREIGMSIDEVDSFVHGLGKRIAQK